ncbi:hypothetical protein [Lacisediminihabitans sp.]|jgi:hypothetical protein|uniref:hypothetical protein n=1 Tax=Lacisediminihabitans sp. TaxID=2787631 RepID=UPI002F95E952
MCQAVTCSECGKVTWAGCGQHVDEVMRNVPIAERCPGHQSETPAGQSLFSRIFPGR